jgi:hypothetical protein
VSKIGWPVIKAKAIFLTGKQGDFGDARKRSFSNELDRHYLMALTVGLGDLRHFGGSDFAVDVAFWFSYPAQRVQPLGKG